MVGSRILDSTVAQDTPPLRQNGGWARFLPRTNPEHLRRTAALEFDLAITYRYI